MSNGYIYCVSTPANNDRCKVGETLTGVEHRLIGLNNSAVSENFKLDYYIVVDPDKRFKIEKSIHNDIINEGYSRFPKKEFFKCNPDNIKHIFQKYGTIYTKINEHNKIDLKEESNKNIKVLPKLQKKYKCDKCNKEFIKKSAYASHVMRINTCIKDTNINNECFYCNKKFSLKHNFKVHMNTCKEKNKNNILQIEDINHISHIEELKNIFEKKFEEQQKKIDELTNLYGNIDKLKILIDSIIFLAQK